MAKEGPSIAKFLLNRKMLGLLLRSRTRNLMMDMKKYGNVFLAKLDKNPDKEAIICGETRLKYRDFKDRINRLNNGLKKLGIKGGDHIACFMGNSNAFLEVVYGPSFSGVRATPINWHLRADEMEYVINNSDTKVLFVDDKYVDKIIPIRSKIKGVKHFIVRGDNVPKDMISYEKFLSESDNTPPETYTPGGGFMIYTSGTTGRPKGTHSRAMDNPAALDPSDIASFITMLNTILTGFNYHKTTNRHLVVGPLYHSAPIAFAGMTFAHGGTVIIMSKFDAEEALKLIEKEKVSTVFGAPIIWKRLLEVEDKNKYDVSSMKSLVCAGAPCPVDTKKKCVEYFGPAFYEFYGSTDAGINTILKPEHYMKDPKRYGSVGKAAPGNKIKILDENGKIAPVGTSGDLHINNPMVKYLEYYKDPEKTKGSFVEIEGEKYFIEGEVACLDEEGFCYIVDRKKDLIISGGVNIYPAEIEEVIHLHPSVSDVAVIGIPDDEFGEAVKAYIVLKDGKSMTEEEMINYCNEKLAGYKRPKEVSFIEEIPRRPDGKMIKRDLREKYQTKSA